MKHYIQFKTLSTGYIPNSIPPKFSEEYVKPIDMLGSDGIYYLDNRLSLDNMINKAYEICKKRNFIGFEIRSYNYTILQSRLLITKYIN